MAVNSFTSFPTCELPLLTPSARTHRTRGKTPAPRVCRRVWYWVETTAVLYSVSGGVEDVRLLDDVHACVCGGAVDEEL